MSWLYSKAIQEQIDYWRGKQNGIEEKITKDKVEVNPITDGRRC